MSYTTVLSSSDVVEPKLIHSQIDPTCTKILSQVINGSNGAAIEFLCSNESDETSSGSASTSDGEEKCNETFD